MGLVATQHVGSSQTRARTLVPCIGRWILNHCATREVPRWQMLNVNNKICVELPIMEKTETSAEDT